MIKNMKRSGRYFSVIIVFSMLLSTIAYAVIQNNNESSENINAINNQDLKTAEDISNMTGIKVESILTLKQNNTWNEVLELLKKEDINYNEELDIQSELLMSAGVEETTIKHLREEGFSEDDITEAKLFIERIVFQLQEISKGEVLPTVDNDTELKQNSDDDLLAYKELMGKIDISLAISLMLKLKEEFGSIESVLDEYLLSLQTDVNLEEYLINKEDYLKTKEEKIKYLSLEKIITIARIEEKAIEMILQDNTFTTDDITNLDSLNQNMLPNEELDAYPQPFTPNVESVNPKNPMEELMKEIEVINPQD